MNTFYITEEQWATLVAGGSITIEGVEYSYDSKNMYCVKTESTPHLYAHKILVQYVTGSYGYFASCIIYSVSNTPFTKETLMQYLYNNGYKYWISGFPATGYCHIAGTDYSTLAIGAPTPETLWIYHLQNSNGTNVTAGSISDKNIIQIF